MSHSRRYDHALGEEFDDRRRCSSCRTTLGRRESQTLRSLPTGPDDCVRTKLGKADMLLIVLMIGLAAGILWFVYDPGYDSNIDRARTEAVCPATRVNKNQKKIQKLPFLWKLWRVIWPSDLKQRIRPGCYKQNQQVDRCS